jgi:hypothetical protein
MHPTHLLEEDGAIRNGFLGNFVRREQIQDVERSVEDERIQPTVKIVEQPLRLVQTNATWKEKWIFQNCHEQGRQIKSTIFVSIGQGPVYTCNSN